MVSVALILIALTAPVVPAASASTGVAGIIRRLTPGMRSPTRRRMYGGAVQHVELQIGHRQPHAHCRQDLHERERPVGHEQPEPVEQQRRRRSLTRTAPGAAGSGSGAGIVPSILSSSSSRMARTGHPIRLETPVRPDPKRVDTPPRAARPRPPQMALALPRRFRGIRVPRICGSRAKRLSTIRRTLTLTRATCERRGPTTRAFMLTRRAPTGMLLLARRVPRGRARSGCAACRGG